MYIEFMCECTSFDCHKAVKLSEQEALAIRADMNHIIIVEGCLTGIEPTDVLVEEKTGYSIYRSEE